MNNDVYSLLEADRIPEAIAATRLIDDGSMDEERLLVHRATQGLLAFKVGQPGRGRELYRQTIARARSKGNLALVSMAALMLARQEVLAGSDVAVESLTTALALSASVSESGVRTWRERLTKTVGESRRGH